MEEIDDTALAERLEGMEESMAQLRETADRIRYELTRRIQERNGTELPSERYRIALEQGSPRYDYGLLRALEELVPPDDYAKAYKAPYTHEVTDQEKWSGTALNSLERRFGGKVALVIQQARIPGEPHLVVKRKETKA